MRRSVTAMKTATEIHAASSRRGLQARLHHAPVLASRCQPTVNGVAGRHRIPCPCASIAWSMHPVGDREQV